MNGYNFRIQPSNPSHNRQSRHVVEQNFMEIMRFPSLKKFNESFGVRLPCHPLENITKPYYLYIKDNMTGIDKTFFKLNDSKITEIPMDFSTSGRHICSWTVPRIFFAVLSVANASASRLEIRETWASEFYTESWRQLSQRRIAFFFGGAGLSSAQLRSLQDESARFGDIVVGDFNDTYDNLSLKMAVVISWVAQYCPNIEAMVKIDMDTFVNVDALLHLLKELPKDTHKNYVYGNRYNNDQAPVMRTGVWSVPKTIYPFEFFPQYVYGHSYVISGSAVKLLSKSFPYFPIIPNEDAFVTGIMSLVLNITRLDISAFGDLTKEDAVLTFDRGIDVTVVMKKAKREVVWSTFKRKKCKSV
ncbi:hypothetical protein RRG08_057124 [Elysia crispata]|uniref:Hexosyltransferase n=1 Tax=Elysia crispata TaxID=231223 RepID=A0AAE1DX21_9GAST|nr:hypothetical protein RRG08_057124 [Elysia crispata]